MRRLSLVRHAKSSWNPELADFERPLDSRGRRDATQMALRLLHEGFKPDRLLSSPALRAIVTARLFAEGFGMDPALIAVESPLYEASALTLLNVVRRQADEDRHVMLFSHNPGVTRFALDLADCPFDEMPTCALASFESAASRWAQFAPGTLRLSHYRAPRDGDD